MNPAWPDFPQTGRFRRLLQADVLPEKQAWHDHCASAVPNNWSDFIFFPPDGTKIYIANHLILAR